MSKKANKEKTISKLIQKVIQTSNCKNNPKQVFDDIIQLAFNCLFDPQVQYTNNFFVDYWVDPQLYRELSEYKNNLESWELLKEATSIFIELLKTSKPFTDVIGEMYDEYLGQVLGQFLTPTDIAETLAQITLAIDEPITSHKIVGDTCGCGAGSLVLGFLRVLYQQQGEMALKHLEIVNMDLDPKMVQLCSIQIMASCMFHDLEIHSLKMHWGNAITEYSGRKDGTSTMAVYWKPNKNKFTISNEPKQIYKKEEETEKQYGMA